MIDEFKKVLDGAPPGGRQREQVVQDFLEQHTELIPTPNRLNHHLHFESVISKFPLGTELTTDYLYITKSSDTWRITLVELESPDKSIFTGDMRRATTSAEFNAALNQVRSWKLFLSENRAEVLRRLEPLLQPVNMRRNPVEFQFQLIIGRSTDKNATPERKKVIRGLIDETGIEIMTFDQLVDWYTNDQRYQKLILRLTGTQYAFKHMHFLPSQILSYVGPDGLTLSQEEIERLKADGYEMDKWSKGDLLTYNWKYAESTWKEDLRNGSLMPPLPKR
ncbi:Shedu immune nuclease family protein [Burkholderia gladioli]|uniref:Shedu immune nuclease family protein n=1 Tax=Burkholderia gladioli TaxID=28095 RepID=UPI0016404090|nr:Shedu immune nuclease family protein [Burkholderia gladioli]